MSLVSFKNPWGAAGAGTDQQRSDLFYFLLPFPDALQGAGGGSGLWDQQVSFAVQEFPFPDRARESMPIKFLQQTNHQIGADTASGAIDVTVRYAFNKRTAELLERWHWMISNPVTGAVALSGSVKTNGYFYWLVPNMAKVANVDDQTPQGAMTLGAKYKIEGCWPRNLKPSNADMTQSNQGVSLTFSLQIDRYYPEKISDLTPGQFVTSTSGLGITSILPGLK